MTYPEPCDSNVFHYVNASKDATNDGWMQAGWVFRDGYIVVRGYCEANNAGPGGQDFDEFNLGFGTHGYSVRRSTRDADSAPVWHCKVDGVLKKEKLTSTLGFSTSGFVQASGEAQTFHGQVGLDAPSKLDLTDNRYQWEFQGSWVLINMVPINDGAPYDSSRPGDGWTRVWTNAH